MHRVYEYFEFDDTNRFLFALGGLALFTLAVNNLFTAATTWYTFRYAYRLNHTLSQKMLRRYLYRPYSYFLDHHSSDLTVKTISEVSQVVNWLIIPTIDSMSRGVVSLFIGLMLFVVNPGLAAIVTLTLGGAYSGIWFFFRRTLKRAGERATHSQVARYRIAGEAFQGIKDVKLFGAEELFLGAFSERSKEFAESQIKKAVIQRVPRYALELVAFGGILLIVLFFVAIKDDLAQVIPLAGLYAVAGHRMLPNLQRMFAELSNIQFTLAAVHRVHADITESDPTTEPAASSGPLSFTHTLELRDLSYRYPTGEVDVICQLDASIPRRSTVGFVGSTGCGKTTLVDIVLGLLRPRSGEIRVDGVTVDARNLRSWQKNLGYVPQEIYLMDATVAENIAFGVGADQIDMQAVERAARVANIHDFVVCELPDGYQNLLGERGIRLSGGQKQRLGIARAVFRNPELLILDEATSALDGITWCKSHQNWREGAIPLTTIPLRHS